MSTWSAQPVECPACGVHATVPLLKGLHITRLPESQEAIRNGTFQVFHCAACGSPYVVERTSVYTDFERGHYVAVEPEACPDWRAARAKHDKVFNDAFLTAPDVAQELSARLTTRLAIGLRALREKVLAWDAGLDDRALEGVKLALMAWAGRDPRQVVYRLLGVTDEGGHLIFGVYPHATPSQDAVVPTTKAIGHDTARRKVYETVLADLPRLRGATPWLFAPWLVDASLGAPRA